MPEGFPAERREVFDFITRRNDKDIFQIHEDQKLRSEAAAIARNKFEQEEQQLKVERRIPMTDSFSGKYEMLSSQKRLQNSILMHA